METRDYTPDSDTVQDNNTGDMQQAWTSVETSPMPADNIYKKAVDAFGQMVHSGLVKERDELKADNEKKTEENALLREENDKLHRLTSNQALELQEYKDKLIKLQDLFNNQRQGEPTVSSDVLHFEFDVVHFDEYITIDQINTLFLKLQEIVNIKTAPDHYLIDTAAAVVPIYIMLTQSKKINPIYRYKGTMSDFCNEWNTNVASRIADKERSQTLTCNYEAFKKEHGRAPWNKSTPATWRNDSKASRNKKKLERAANTKMHLERLLQ